ncbi:MAG: hypothetical protein RIC55_10270 [Pirellulaceae bacterium]
MLHLIVCSALLLGASPSESEPERSAEQSGVSQTDVERAARDYRIQVYDSYRLDRDEYDARREAGDRLLEGFIAAGNPRAYQDEVIDWFRTSQQLSRDGEAAPLPDLPTLPDPLPENVAAADPAASPHRTETSSLDIELPTSAQDDLSANTDFLGSPETGNLESNAGTGHGAGYLSTSKILHSLKRALISSATTDGDEHPNETGAPTGDDSTPAEGTRDTVLPQTKAPVSGDDPFAPRNLDAQESLLPALTEPGN